jgi:hypothetical protein
MSGEHGMARLKTQTPDDSACPGADALLLLPLLLAPLPLPLPAPPLLALPLGFAKGTTLAARGVLPGKESCRAGGVVAGTGGGSAVDLGVPSGDKCRSTIHDAVAPPATAWRTREASVMRLLTSARNTRSSSDCARLRVAM